MRRAAPEAFQRRPEGEISVEVEERKESKEIKPDIQDRAAEIKETAEVKTMQDIYGEIHKLEEQIGAMRRELALGTQDEEKKKEAEFFLSAKQEALEILEKMRDSKEEIRLPKEKLEEIEKMREDLERLEQSKLKHELSRSNLYDEMLDRAESRVKKAFHFLKKIDKFMAALKVVLTWIPLSPVFFIGGSILAIDAEDTFARSKVEKAQALMDLARAQKDSGEEYSQTLDKAKKIAEEIKYRDLRNPLKRLTGRVFSRFTNIQESIDDEAMRYDEKKADIIAKIEELAEPAQKKEDRDSSQDKINELRQKLIAEEQSITALSQERL